ncbi:hypothetical protein V5799_027499 [Amblyomma americanum]|uniref:Uncharacterized protein n=1 Tax=Amblyomma americanum TaxID=6943 RepID=A0AAQ4DFJ2_AMBAM
MAAFKKTADPTASSCFFTRRLKSRFYLVVQSERITIIEASEGHGPPERNLHEMSGTKIDEDNLSKYKTSTKHGLLDKINFFGFINVWHK